MRPDQIKRIDELSESLMDIFLDAADPSAWSGAGQSPDEMDERVRGARNWDCKNANQIGALAARALDLRERIAGKGGKVQDDDAEADISKFEKQAREAMKKAGLVR